MAPIPRSLSIQTVASAVGRPRASPKYRIDWTNVADAVGHPSRGRRFNFVRTSLAAELKFVRHCFRIVPNVGQCPLNS